jgi:hypothetical protein
MEEEVWKDIEGYPGYQVSNMGRVKSLVKAYRREEIILKGSPNTTGYTLVQLYPKPRQRKSLLVHRLVMMTFQPNPVMDELEVNHKDLDTTNNKMSNLEWVTSRENKDHYVASDKFKTIKREMVCGEDQHLSKLTEVQVLEIRELHETGNYKTIKEVCEFYGISRSAHADVVKGRTWKHLLPNV